MTTLVLGVAGAAVGSAIGGPLGASIGWSLGAALGSYIDPQKIEGPKLSDLQLQTSRYGAPIPIVYGSYRLAGSVIWQTELHPHENKDGGKGGGAEVTTYSYSASFAIMLCEGPIEGVRRVWWNSRLVRDPDNPEIADLPITIYLGDETQTADPLIEADKGAGNVPAHRGTAYVVFNEQDLSPGGNAIGNWEFEVVTASATQCPIESIAYGLDDNAPTGGWASQGNDNDMFPYVVTMVDALPYAMPITSQAPREQFGVSWTAGQFGDGIDHGGVGAYAGPVHVIGDTALPVWFQYNVQIGYPVTVNSWVLWFGGSQPTAKVFISDCGMEVVDYGQWDAASGWRTWYVSNGYGVGSCLLPPPAVGFAVIDNGLPQGRYIRGISSSNDGRRLFVFTSATASDNPGADQWHEMVNGQVVRNGTVDPPLDYKFYGTASFVGGDLAPFYVSEWENNGRYLWNYQSAAGGQGVHCLWIDDSGNLAEICDSVALTTPGIFSVPAISAFAEGRCVVVAKEHYEVFRRTSGYTALQPVPLSDIVSDVSERAGLEAGEIDVNALTDLVDGYCITAQMDARSALQPLQAAFFFDAVESDGQCVFVKRDGASIATIPNADLAAHVYGSDPPAEVTISRQQEVDLPNRVTLSYANYASDYQPGLQMAARQTGYATRDIALECAIVMSDDYAKAAADATMYAAWVERDVVRFAVSREYARLDPTDIVTMRGRAVRLLQRNEQATGVLVFEGVPVAPGIWQTAAPGGDSGGFIQPAPPITNPTELVLLDLPMVLDADAPNGFYAAMAGYTGDAWPGAVLFISRDGGTTYTEYVRAAYADTFGYTTNELDTYAGGNTFDELNRVAVVLTEGSGTLSSATELAVLNGANMAAIGDEIIQFKTATLTATRTYTLSGLLRGRRGTEWAMTEHTERDRFVLLPVQSNPAMAFNEVGVEYDYKAVTVGGVIGSAPRISFTNDGAALRAYTPVHLGGGRVGDDIILTWERRERVSGGWVNGADIPVTDPLSFVITIYEDGTYAVQVRSSTVTFAEGDALTWTYTAAMQTADFGSPVVGPIYWAIYRSGPRGDGTIARGST